MATPAGVVLPKTQLTPEEFHKAIHSAVGIHTKHYLTIRRGKKSYRKQVESVHKAGWSEAFVEVGHKKIKVSVYLNLKQNDLSDTLYQQLKNKALMGISQYWSRRILVDGQPFSVQVSGYHREGNAIEADLRYHKMKDRGDYSRSFNIGSSSIDASFVYNEWPTPNQVFSDQDFKLTSAHEFGHSVLMYFGGAKLSWGHKGSTHIIPQSVKKTTPGYPVKGEIDLMQYYDRNKRRASMNTRASRSKASEQDVMRLIWLSTLNF